MATMVLTAAYISITGPGVLNSYCSKVELTAEVEEKDVTIFASQGWKEVTGGLKSGSLALSLFNDYTGGTLDQLMWTAFLGGVPVAFEVRYNSASVSTSNPKYTGYILPKTWAPLNGAVGDVATVDISWPTSGAITRTTS